MDEIFKYYNEMIAAPNEYSVYMGSDKHGLNINYLKNNRKIEIDSFIGHFVKAFRIIEPRLRAKRKLVFVRSLGGHIEIKEPGFAELWIKYQNEIDQVIRHFNHIKGIDQDIISEMDEIEKMRTDKLADAFEFNQIINGSIAPAKGTQLTISF